MARRRRRTPRPRGPLERERRVHRQRSRAHGRRVLAASIPDGSQLAVLTLRAFHFAKMGSQFVNAMLVSTRKFEAWDFRSAWKMSSG